MAWTDNLISKPSRACEPASFSEATLASWVERHAGAPARQRRWRRDLLVSDTDCSLQNLCDPWARPRVCFHNTDICDGVADCGSGRDELHCEDCLCPYRKTSGVTMDVPASAQDYWAGVNLRACARTCNDAVLGCVAFSFNALKNGADRCRLFFRSGRLLAREGYELYAREKPSMPRLLTSPPGNSSVPTNVGLKPFGCPNQDMVACKAGCIPLSQVCDGVVQCTSFNEERICNLALGIYQRQPGHSLTLYSVPFSGVSLATCAFYCMRHFEGHPKCRFFAYHQGSGECLIGCSSCDGAAGVVEDPSSDYYSFSVGGAAAALKAAKDAIITAKPNSGSHELIPDVQNRVLLSSGVTNRVVSGHRASYGTYPWQAQIEAYNEAGYFEHHCGGVLIGSRHVLTAAHCISRALSALQVKVGQHDRMDASEPHEQTFAIENVLSHPEYRATAHNGYANDLAVVKLRVRQGRPVAFSDHVQPLCLPAADAPLQTGQPCEISGWGKTNPLLPNTVASAARELHGGEVPLVSDAFCGAQEVYGARFVAGRMVCAGHVAGGTDTCQGDSGGPLACRSDDGRWLLTGVASTGTGCGSELNPGVYTRVGFYVPWIRRVVQLL
ncbi:transmembrane protease serine 2-like [Pollicipes pollicipes]|uniref:transmembrane protease serine 2-like n=1 Tax=Pollicipes pollicipes TaxID=41117 RepID=UPI001885520D|nr:transmembrane protease serine 2-like [Pollicipes pollicipes]